MQPCNIVIMQAAGGEAVKSAADECVVSGSLSWAAKFSAACAAVHVGRVV